MDEHEQIAIRIAETFIKVVYIHTVHQDHKWAPGTAMATITPASLQSAIALALSTFAREYGLKPHARPE